MHDWVQSLVNPLQIIQEVIMPAMVAKPISNQGMSSGSSSSQHQSQIQSLLADIAQAIELCRGK